MILEPRVRFVASIANPFLRAFYGRWDPLKGVSDNARRRQVPEVDQVLLHHLY